MYVTAQPEAYLHGSVVEIFQPAEFIRGDCRAPRAGSRRPPSPSRWWRLIGGVLMTLALGTLYAWSIFVAPLEQEFGWRRAQTSTVFTIAVVMFALSFVIAGRLQDRFGPFWIAITGGLLVSLGFFLCAYTTSLPYLYFVYGVLGGIGNGFGYATVVPVMSKRFPDKRGLAIGLALAGYGGGSAIFGPIADLQMFPHFGWRNTCMILAGNLSGHDYGCVVFAARIPRTTPRRSP